MKLVLILPPWYSDHWKSTWIIEVLNFTELFCLNFQYKIMYSIWQWQFKLIIFLVIMASIMVTPVQSNNLKNYAKFNLTQPKLSVRVSSTHYEPYMYRNEKGEFVNGIEYKLLEVIAQKESLRLFFQNQPDPLNNDDFISRYDAFLGTNWDINYKLEYKFEWKLFSRSSFDIMVGGIFPNSTLTATLAASKPYHQDELTWCIQRAKYFPSVIRIFMVATPECWILAIFGIGYLSGFIIYLMIQFDLKYKHRNRRDWHYAQWLIAVPAVLTMNQRFQPFYAPLRMYYVLLLIFSVFLWQIVFFHAVRFYKFPVQREQIKTVNEIVDDGFRLAGSADVLHLITFDPQVIRHMTFPFSLCELTFW